jgi:hypothetical protein
VEISDVVVVVSSELPDEERDRFGQTVLGQFEMNQAMTAASGSLRMLFLPLWAVRAAGLEWNLLLGTRSPSSRLLGSKLPPGVYAQKESGGRAALEPRLTTGRIVPRAACNKGVDPIVVFGCSRRYPPLGAAHKGGQ